jgi:hypothetical protein
MPIIVVTRLRLRDPALHLTADGKAADLTHPSAANQTLDFPPPVRPPPSVS